MHLHLRYRNDEPLAHGCRGIASPPPSIGGELVFDTPNTLVALAASAGIVTQALAQDKDQDRDRTQLRDHDRIYGTELMTQQARLENRYRLQAMKAEQEREAYLLEHHKHMQERAHEKGVKLPDVPLHKRSGPMDGGAMGGVRRMPVLRDQAHHAFFCIAGQRA